MSSWKAGSANAARLSPAQLEQYRRLSTCIVASAIETFRVRLPNTGFADSGIHCFFPKRPAVIGYAATARVRCANPPMERERRFFYERTDWWNHILTIPAPRIVVMQDVDHPPGVGALVGEVHASILQALGCVALATNGAVRDLRQIEPTGFQMFAGNPAVSHAYAHVFDFGGAVEIGGLSISPGDLIHGDLHGIQTIPVEIAAQAPKVAADLLQKRQSVIGLCRAENFSLERLRAGFREIETSSREETE